MSLTEMTGFRSTVYSAWHRPNKLRRYLPAKVADDMTMVDIDALLRCERWIEACKGCYEPLVLIETYVDNKQTYKCAAALRKLAARAGVEAYVVRYVPNENNTDITAFHVRRVQPWREEWVEWTPQQYADFLVRVRARARTCTCASTERQAA